MANVGVAHEGVDDRAESLVGDLRGEELEEPVQLVGVAPKGRCQRGRVRVRRRLYGSHLHLQPTAEALDSPEHMDGVALIEALVEELDVGPDPRLYATARVGELEREVCGAVAGAPALLLRHSEHALDGPVLGELGDRGHVPSLWRRGVGTLAAMVAVQPFRAVRYSGAAGRLADLVAPPYDAVDELERAELYTRSPYNVVHLTLPDSADEAGSLYREWLAQGVLERDGEPGAWLSVESYVGPDGVARERRGVIVSLAAEPYEAGTVLPHERTHERIREDRLRLLRATRVQPEPIFLLTEQSIAVEQPEGRPDLEVDGTRLWTVDVADLDVGQLLIADGHHRYESAVALSREPGGEDTRIMGFVVSKDDPGLHVFPTHRVFAGRPDLEARDEGDPCGSAGEARRVLADERYDHAAVIAYRRDRVALVRGGEGVLDAELVDRHGLEGIRYTPRLDEAVGAVDRGEADVAYLLREPRVDDVFSVALRGGRMPQKSTYFYPKPLSGLLFHPLDR
jgi:uncharacterized protein (DUF1015 family)